jgi:hypothetical protein
MAVLPSFDNDSDDPPPMLSSACFDHVDPILVKTTIPPEATSVLPSLERDTALPRKFEVLTSFVPCCTNVPAQTKHKERKIDHLIMRQLKMPRLDENKKNSTENKENKINKAK